jgi:hypothetical protein
VERALVSLVLFLRPGRRGTRASRALPEILHSCGKELDRLNQVPLPSVTPQRSPAVTLWRNVEPSERWGVPQRSFGTLIL